MAELEQQLEQLEELLSLFDAKALREAQEALEHQIADLTERLEVTRQALAQAHAQRRRLARARLLLEGAAPSAGKPNEASNDGDDAASDGDAEADADADTDADAHEPPTFLPERRSKTGERRKDERRTKNGDRHDTSELAAS